MDNEKILEALNVLIQEQAAMKAMLKEETTALKEYVQEQNTMIRQDIKALSDKVDNGFKDTRSELVDAIEVVGQKVDKLEHSIHDVETVTAQNAFDVQLMKRKA